MSKPLSEFPRTTKALKAVFERAGLRPRKEKGQHFLTDVQAVDAIVRDAGVREGDVVVEVGTGPGLLTVALAEAGAQVISFDVDADVQRLARSLVDWPERVEFREGDVLESKHRLSADFLAALEIPAPSPDGRRLMVSNLPYGAATPIILGVLGMERPPDGLTVMVQLEVAEKMLAAPGGAIYGGPSIQVGVLATGRILRRFGAGVFWPPPNVRSALLELIPRADRPLSAEEQARFARFVTALLTRRRKVLPTALRQAAPHLDAAQARAAVEAQGLPADVRVQAVAPESLLALWRAATQTGEQGAADEG